MTKVSELDKSIEGSRVRVTQVAHSQAEELGYVDDTNRLMHQTGLAERLTNPNSGMAQLWVRWDNEPPGALALAGSDEIEEI
jgi:hypothetical protein